MPQRPHNFRALSKPKRITKSEHKHYWPYIPVLLLVVATMLVSLLQPSQHRGVLAYSTDISASGLLVATNQQREQNQTSDLTLDAKLNAAAQAKANDMVNRNYWSHNTPDDQAPWVFISQTGYQFQKAGENLAYGFTDAKATITGWMNSPHHRENLLDSGYTQVGFGFANSTDFNNSGPETVIVAMYGRPQVLGASVVHPYSPEAANSATAVVADSGSQHVTRIQSLLGDKAPWAFFATGILSGLAMAVLLIKHATGFRHILRSGEQFVLEHVVIDTILVGVVFVGTLLSQTIGFIR